MINNVDVNDSAPADEPRNPIRFAWRRSRPGLVVVGVLSVFINLLRFAPFIYVLQLLDRVISSRSVETLLMLTIMVVTAVIFGALLSVVRRRLLIAWGNWILRFFGPPLFAASLKKSSYQKTNISGVLRDVGTVRYFVASDGLVAWIDVIWAPIFLTVIYFVEPLFGHIILIGCLLAVLLGALSELISRDSRTTSFQAKKDALDWVTAAERHQDTVGSLNIMRNFAKRWCSSAFTRLDEKSRAQIIRIDFSAAIRTVGRLVRISIFAVGVWLVIYENLQIAAIIAGAILGRTTFNLVRSAASKWRDMIDAKNAYGRMKDVLKKDSAQQVSVPTSNQPTPLVVEKVSYRYPQQFKMLFRDISLTVNPGEALYVIGPSASGKTTFTRLVSGLFAPRSGHVRFGEVDVFRLQQNSQSRLVGTLPQDTTLFNGTVRENIAGMSLGDIDEVVRAAKLAGIHDTILALPKGYDTEIGEYEPLLSSGQRKAVALARAFYGRPRLVVLDEPIPHLDKAANAALFKAIKELKAEGTIVVLTTQSKVPSKYADKVILFEPPKYRILSSAEEIASLRTQSRASRKHPKRAAKNNKEQVDE